MRPSDSPTELPSSAGRFSRTQQCKTSFSVNLERVARQRHLRGGAPQLYIQLFFGVSMPTPAVPKLSSEAREQFDRFDRLVQPPSVGRRVWQRLFSEAQRRRLGGDVKEAWLKNGTVGMWMKVKRVSHFRALVQLAAALFNMSVAEQEWLLNEAGQKTSVVVQLPQWDLKTRALSLDGRILRKYAVHAKNVCPVLSAFEEEGWPPQVFDPLPGRNNAARLHRTIASLNNGLTAIRFNADGQGTGYTWRHV